MNLKKKTSQILDERKLKKNQSKFNVYKRRMKKKMIENEHEKKNAVETRRPTVLEK